MSEEAIQDTGSQEVATEAPVRFVDTLDESLRSNPSLQNFPDANALAKSYVHARSHIGADKIVKPQSSWTDDQYNQFYAETGRPETANDYDLKITLEDPNENTWNNYKDAAHAAGLNGKQAQKIAEFFENTLSSTDESFYENAALINEQTERDLQREFGEALGQKSKYGIRRCTTVHGSRNIRN